MPRVPGRGRGGRRVPRRPARAGAPPRGPLPPRLPHAHRGTGRGPRAHAAPRLAADRDRDRGPRRRAACSSIRRSRATGRHVLLDGEPLAESDGAAPRPRARHRHHDRGPAPLRPRHRGAWSPRGPSRTRSASAARDIMARIHYDGEHRGRLLQRTLLGYLTHCIEALPVRSADDLRAGGGRQPHDARPASSGSTCSRSGVMPYRSTTEAALAEGRADDHQPRGRRRRSCGCRSIPTARVYGLPLVGSHVGADAAACLLATGIAEGDESARCSTSARTPRPSSATASACSRHRARRARPSRAAASAAACRRSTGAIERVPTSRRRPVEVEVIGDAAPAGLCGSGLVDLLSELQRTGRMNGQGRFVERRAHRRSSAARACR